MNTREQHIDSIMESLSAMERAAGDPLMHDKVVARIAASGRTVAMPSTGWLLKVAAGLALLVSVNAVTLWYYSRQSSSNPVATGYFNYVKTITPEL